MRQSPAAKYKRRFDSDTMLIKEFQQGECTILIEVLVDLVRACLTLKATELVQSVDGRKLYDVAIIV